MKKSKFSFAVVFSLMVLFIYSYLSFMGMVYWQNGNLTLPLTLTAGLIVLVLVCLYVMCRARATRWRSIGNSLQALFGLVILGGFLASAVPFTNFVDVVKNHNKFSGEINRVLSLAKGLDSTYMAYTAQRLDDYRQKLQMVSDGKIIQPTEYETLLSNAGGASDEAKINNLVNSLKRKLVPDSMETVRDKRLQWLNSAANMSVWNLKLPTTIDRINGEVDKWIGSYVSLTETIYAGEESKAFEYPQFKTELVALKTNYTRLNAPSALALMVSLVCFFIMLLPYWLTERDVAGNASSGKVWWKFWQKTEELEYM